VSALFAFVPLACPCPFPFALALLLQVCGGILGTTILWACFSTHHLRTYELFDGTNVWQKLVMSILVSFLSTFVLVITNFAVVQPVGHKHPAVQGAREEGERRSGLLRGDMWRNSS
jgi:glycerol uptake facilitator-like aquaporin